MKFLDSANVAEQVAEEKRHLTVQWAASFSETSGLVYSSALRSFAIVLSKSSFSSHVGLLCSPFLKPRVPVWFRSVIIWVGVWVRQFINSWPFPVSLAINKSSKGFFIKLIDWDTDNMLSLSLNSVDSNKSLAFAEATGIVLRTQLLFTSSSQRSVSSPSLSNSALNPALSGLKLSDECFPPFSRMV